MIAIGSLVVGLGICLATVCAGPTGAAVTAGVTANSVANPVSPSAGRSATTGAGAASSAPTIVISGMHFSAVTATASKRVQVKNNDSVAHTVTARNGSFNVTVPPGTTRTFRAPSRPGNYPFTCVIHPSMSGKLRVIR